jgi:hypothetical protein
MKPRGLLTHEEVEKVMQLKRSDPTFATMRQLAMQFRGILHGRNPAKLDVWFDDAHPSGMPSVSFGAMVKPRVKLTASRL